MGIVLLYFQHRGFTDYPSLLPRFGVVYLSISVSLNVLLTLMIVVRLVLHGRNLRAATGSPAGIGGLYKAISTTLIESCALFAVSSLVVVGALGRTGGYDRPDVYFPATYVLVISFPILAQTQVRASPRPQYYPGQLSDATMDLTGHRSTAHHPTGRQPECANKPHYHH